MLLTEAIARLQLPPATAAAFTALFEPRKVKAKTHLILPGDAVRQFLYVEQGVLRAYYTHPNGRHVTKVFFCPGMFASAFGALLSGQPSQQSLQAITACQVQTACYDAFKGLWQAHPALERLSRQMTEMIYLRKEQREAELTLMDARERYLRFQAMYPALLRQLPLHYIASYLNITPAQLSRIRSGLRRQQSRPVLAGFLDVAQ